MLFLLALASCTPATQGGAETTPTLPGKDPLLNFGKKKPAEPEQAKPTKQGADPWSGRKDLIAAPDVPASQPIPLPAAERYELPSGLQVVIVPDPQASVVATHLVIPDAGGDAESVGARGVSDVTAALLTRGTRSKPGDKLAMAASLAGASLAADSDAEAAHVSCDAMASDLGVCLDLIADMVLAPQFAPAAFDDVKKEVLATLRARREDAQSLGNLHVRNLLWGDEAVRGSPATTMSLEALTVKAVADWHKARYVPNNAILVVVGGVDVASTKAAVAKSLTRWARSASASAPPAAPSVPAVQPGLKVRVIDRPDATTATIILARDGVSHADADYLPTLIDNEALGGDAGGTRMAQLGSKLGGKLLGARAFIERARGKSAILISAGAKSAADVPGVLSGLIDTMKTFAADGPTSDELASARIAVAGSYAFGYERPADAAAALATAELHGLSDAWVREFPAAVAAVDPAAAKKAAVHFDPGGLVVVIVGRASDIVPLLEKKKIQVERLAWSDEITRRDRELAKAPRAGDEKKAAEGKKLLEAAITARGGNKLVNLKSVKASGKMVIHANGRDVPGTFQHVYVAPDRQRTDMTIPDKGTATLVIGPTLAFVSFQDKINEVPAADRPSLDVVTAVDPEKILLVARDKAATVMSDGEQTVDGKKYAVVVIQGKGDPVTVLLDARTHLPFRVYYMLEGQQVFDEYGGYKAVGGIQMAHTLKTVNVVLGVPIDVTYDKIEIDGKVDPKLFDKP